MASVALAAAAAVRYISALWQRRTHGLPHFIIHCTQDLHRIMATKSVRPEQVQKAVAALLKFVGQQEQTNLLEDDELLHLVRGAAACRAATCMSIR